MLQSLCPIAEMRTLSAAFPSVRVFLPPTQKLNFCSQSPSPLAINGGLIFATPPSLSPLALPSFAVVHRRRRDNYALSLMKIYRFCALARPVSRPPASRWALASPLVQGAAAAAALFKVRIAEWHATKRRFGESAAVRDSPPFLKPTKFSAST